MLPSPVAELAREAGIEVLQPESVRDEDFLTRLRARGADVFLVVAYGELLRQEFLDIPKIDCLNVHPSLLPRHRGASPIPAAILAGDRETGVSIQRVVLKLDAGDVLVQARTEIRPGETAGDLGGRLMELSADVTLEALDMVARNELHYTPQDPERVTFCRKLTKETGYIDWHRSAAELERHVLGMNPWPLARTMLPGGKKGLNVHRARARTDVDSDAAPGTILATDGELLVRSGGGALELVEVQADGKRAMVAGEFLRGARVAVGEMFEAVQ